MHLESREAQEIGRRVYPSYMGRKFRLTVRDGASSPMSLTSYWDGGSRDYYRVVRLADFAIVEVPQNGTPFDGLNFGAESLPAPGFMVVEHSIFCGKDVGLTFHVHPENAAKFLPAAATAELTWGQRVVLCATRSLKSSHNGRTRADAAVEETGITRAEWDEAKSLCISQGLLNAAGAATIAGKNAKLGASQWVDLYHLGQERKAVAV
jgi:hypothetical protein